MFPSIVILGRQPAFGLAELESLYGADALQPFGDNASLLNVPVKDVAFSRLGGSIKLAKTLTSLDATNWNDLVDYIVSTIPKHLDYLPEGKLKFGLSVYGFSVTPAKISASALTIKKAIKLAGRSVRVVPNKEAALNSAQVLHNQLTNELGMELLLIKNGNSTILAQTVAEQNIDSYAARDHGRPMRDAKVGMLPPKLAQIIVNTAVGNTDQKTLTVLDPFCGTGVVLQEATLMGYEIYGSDLEKRMVGYADKNLKWLRDTSQTYYKLELADATNHTWTPTPDAIACETYLGRPFSSVPKPELVREVMQDVDTIHKKFLRNVAAQTTAGFRMTIAVPAWRVGGDFKHLRALDSLEELGYNRVKFVHARNEDLIYHREGQVVARELVTIIRK